MPGSWLVEVVQEITRKLIADDWLERTSNDGSGSYYIIGADAYRNDLNTQGHGYSDCVPSAHLEAGPLAEHVVRSQVAGSRTDYLKRESKRLESAGVSPVTIGRLIDGDPEALAGLWPASLPFREGLVKYIIPFLEALRVSRGMTELDQDEIQEVNALRAKLCLREVIGKYAKIVDKWELLDPLPFEDQRLEEASKAYLYGFYRAAIVLAAAALEKHLKRVAEVKDFTPYKELVEDAAACHGLGTLCVEQAMAVFRVRNKVVHDDYPSRDEAPELHDKAHEVLVKARYVLTKILSDDEVTPGG